MSARLAEPLSPGQKKAVESIRTIAKLSRGALTIDAVCEQSVDGVLIVRIWLSSASLPRSEQGLRLRPWEPIDIQIYDDFPDSPPIAAAGHADFNSLPHVAHGSGFCLRVSPNNWDPGSGMAGFLQEVIATYRHISLGSLAGHLLPWQPPPADPRVGCVVVNTDVPPAHRASSEPLLAWAAAAIVGPDRINIIEWFGCPQEIKGEGEQAADGLSKALKRLQDINEEVILAPALILPRPTALEYSGSVDDLLDLSGDMRVANRFLQDLGFIHRLNKKLCKDESQENPPPAILLLRSPADTSSSGSDLEAHFAAGRLAPDDAQLAERLVYDDSDETAWRQMADDLLAAPIFWAQVYDGRPEVLLRRGAGRPTERLSGTRVLVLGCGALGAHIAEQCVRAGVTRLHLADSDNVSPGILVRQPYEDADIGQAKADVLTERLRRIRPQTVVSATVGDILSMDLPGGEELGPPDLIIDATASRAVATKIERIRRNAQDTWPTLVTLGIGQTATAGIAAVSPPGFAGAGVHLLRRLGLETSRDEELADIHDLFFPSPRQRRVLFHPEPGCSDATFVGSATDVGALAAQLLDSALTCFNPVTARPPASSAAGSIPGSLCIARLGRDGGNRPARVVLAVPPDRLVEDTGNTYQVRLDQQAAERMLQIIAASKTTQDPADKMHIGGLLLGQFDDACQVVWVSEVTSPPPGSTTRQLGLELNISAAQKYIEARREQTRGLVSHIGFWHVHQGSLLPSATDQQAIQQLLGYAPRMLLLVVGYPDAASNAHGPALSSTMLDIYAEVFTA